MSRPGEDTIRGFITFVDDPLMWQAFTTGLVVCHLIYFLIPWISRRLFARGLYDSLSQEFKDEWRMRAHSTIISTMVTISFVHGRYWEDFSYRSTRLGRFSGGVSIAYFFYDFITMMKNYHLMSFGSGLHHVLGFLMTLCCCGFNYCLGWGMVMLFTEITTPLLNALWFLKAIGMRHSKLYDYAGYALFIGFFFFRVLVHLFLVYEVIKFIPGCDETRCFGGVHWINMTFTKTLMPGMALLNWYWFYRMAVIVFQHVKKGGSLDDAKNEDALKHGEKAD